MAREHLEQARHHLEKAHEHLNKMREEGEKRTIEPRNKSEKKISFKEGGLHASTHTKPGEKISAKKHEEAREGKLGGKAEKQERFYENVLKGRGRGK
jgi:hypothetical protein